ncbi:hypothetical protein C0Q70_05858 [Pomacea canaliculata]|uniref:Uncharacterized protein n=1 Tax=Pomacea canaliculata TaxID=400727 RepID=A0A2T7PMF5_POMCA|nr:hypothetical protein C0Q70_05858 [Pomacea canaliculata]
MCHRVPTSGPPGSAYYKPVSVVCPGYRYMLKAFHYDGKQCYVIKPEVQQCSDIGVTFVGMYSDQSNRDCHYCSYSQGGISKCDEEYEWRTVWAYCKPIYPINVYPPLYPPVPPVKPPVYPIPPYNQKVILRQDDVYVKTSYPEPYPRKIGYYGRKKRSVVPQHAGSIEHVTLFLPFQCSCKELQVLSLVFLSLSSLRMTQINR